MWRRDEVEVDGLTRLEQGFFSSLEIVEAPRGAPRMPEPPTRFWAVGAGGVWPLRGDVEAWNAAVSASGEVPTGLADAPTAYLHSVDWWTSGATWGDFLIGGVDEVPWFEGADSGWVERVREGVGDALGPPVLASTSDGWSLTKWVIEGQRLVERVLSCGSSGVVERRDTEWFSAMPVPEGRYWSMNAAGKLVPVG